MAATPPLCEGGLRFAPSRYTAVQPAGWGMIATPGRSLDAVICSAGYGKGLRSTGATLKIAAFAPCEAGGGEPSPKIRTPAQDRPA